MSHLLKGSFFDGRSSLSRAATVSRSDAGVVSLVTESMTRQASIDSVTISPRVGDSPRFLVFPDGGKFETSENDLVAIVFAQNLKGGESTGWSRTSALLYFLWC